jgi:hypothetical protein
VKRNLLSPEPLPAGPIGKLALREDDLPVIRTDIGGSAFVHLS